MRWLYPKIPAARLLIMAKSALLGLVLAVVFGAAHDQISYAISPEYFTRLKFRQFAWADVGLPPRAFASVVGALAAGSVGLVSGWLLSRAGLAELAAHDRRVGTWQAFGLVAALAPVGGLIGWGLGVLTGRGDLSAWADWQRTLGLEDLPGFVVVAFLHAGGYIGALVGLVWAFVIVRRRLARFRSQLESSQIK